MMLRPFVHGAVALTCGAVVLPTTLAAQTPDALPSPLRLADVVRLAGDRRDEIERWPTSNGCGPAREGPSSTSAWRRPTRS